MIRLRYAALFVSALVACLALLLMLNALGLLLLPFAVIGFVGMSSPNVISKRTWLRRTSNVGLIVLGSFCLLFIRGLVVSRRRPVELVVEGTAPKRVRIVYGVADGDQQPLSWSRKILVPRNDIAFVKYSNGGSWSSADDPHPLTVTTRTVTGVVQKGIGSWVGGGYTEGGACHFEYDEYSVGNSQGVETAARPRVSESGWLDSLSTWAVECRSGKLVRSRSGAVPNIQRTGAACYYMADGAVGCSSVPRVNDTNTLAR